MAPIRSAAALLFVAALGLPACAPEVSTHGYRFDEAALAQLEPGRTTRDGTLQLLGSPSSAATFDDQGVIQSIDRQSLEDAKEVALVDRETPTSGSELGILEQFIGNIGRFNPQPEADARR